MAYSCHNKPKREGISLAQFLEQYIPNEAAAEAWLTRRRWPDGVRCAHCESSDVVERANRRPQPYWCRACHRYFSVKTNSLMRRSHLSCRIWVSTVYLMLGPVEIDETYMGGKARNRYAAKRDGKRAVVGILDRVTSEVRVEVIEDTRKDELQGYLEENVSPDATIYSDQSPSYVDVPNPHVAVLHSAGQYVHQQAHINGIESFWAMLKRATSASTTGSRPSISIGTCRNTPGGASCATWTRSTSWNICSIGCSPRG